MSGGLDFAILGPLRVARAGEELVLGGPRQRAVLGRLLLEPNVVVPREQLIQDLWGDDASPQVASTLRSYLSHLRRALGSTVLVSRRPGYMVDIDARALDCARFERLAAKGRSRLDEGDAAGAVTTLREALGLWRGRVLADLDPEPFRRAGLARLEDRRLAVVEDWAEAELALGHHSRMTAELEPLVAEAPLRERRWELLMLALYRSGRQAEALRAFQSARDHLAELGIEPGPALRDLEEAILLQKADLDWQPPRSAALVVPAEAPTPAAPPPSAPPSALIGRQRELEALAAAVEGARSR